MEAGERVALVGPSGAGKSTLLGVCNRTVLPHTGHALVLAHELRVPPPGRLAAVRRQIGMVHQELDLVDQLRVVHNVNAGRLGHWGSGRALRSLVRPVEVEEARGALVARLHDFDLALRHCDRVVGLRDGRVVFDRAARDVDDDAHRQLYELETSP